VEFIHTEEQWVQWIDELAQEGFVCIDNFFPISEVTHFLQFLHSHKTRFTKAGIGALDEHTIRHDIRGDHTYWLDRQRDTSLNSLWQMIDDALYIFNRYCYLSLSGFEFHLANYPPTAHYAKHLDQFNNRSNRIITVVIYLNTDWQAEDGGELELFLPHESSVIIEPIAGRAILFKSADIPHQVLKANKNRYSISGWLLRHPSALGKFIG
jgi:SM-20-related protein